VDPQALGPHPETRHIPSMKLNSDASLKTASEVFRNYGFSWSAVRQAAHRGDDGVLVAPLSPPAPEGVAEAPAPDSVPDIG